jgi:type 1 glutamine amidotransferase
MKRTVVAELLAGAGAIALCAWIAPALGAQGRGGQGSMGPELFSLFDANKDGSLTSAELQGGFDKWYASADTAKSGSVSQEQLSTAITASLGQPAQPAGGGRGFRGAGAGAAGARGRAAGAAPAPIVWGTSAPDLKEPCGGRSQTPTVACQKDIDAMMAALPATAPAKPMRARKVLIWSRLPSAGFQHSSIPLAAKTVEELGRKTGAWTSDTSWDPAVFTADNLKQYDAIFLASTTGCFLDDPADIPLTMARRKALLDFVRGGKGLVGIHATGDSYHGGGGCVTPEMAAGNAAPARGAGGFRGRGAAGPGRSRASVILRWSWGLNDKKLVNDDMTLTKSDMDAVSAAWYGAIDTAKAGKVSQQDFETRITGLISTQAGPTNPYVGAPGRDNGRGTWPDYDNMIGGFFKYHWYDPQHITVKIDDPKSPLTAMFNGQEFGINDETYTFSVNSFSRKNVRVLTSIDYDKMSFTDKLKESNPRPDHDFGLSWIHRDGQGRVFYMALGHDERIYAITPMMAHLLAGMQYALGDLKADDAPSAK